MWLIVLLTQISVKLHLYREYLCTIKHFEKIILLIFSVHTPLNLPGHGFTKCNPLSRLAEGFTDCNPLPQAGKFLIFFKNYLCKVRDLLQGFIGSQPFRSGAQTCEALQGPSLHFATWGDYGLYVPCLVCWGEGILLVCSCGFHCL